MNKDIPIIFSGPMVRALLEGRKTMTRRILKQALPLAPAMDAICPGHAARHDAPYFDSYRNERRSVENPQGMSRNWCWWTRDDRQCLPTVNVRYQPGDRLWVRENFAHVGTCDPGFRTFQATYPNDLKQFGIENVPATLQEAGHKWTPSIHMPRIWSRLTLIVTAVKVERLRDISEKDAEAEGCVEDWADGLSVWYVPGARMARHYRTGPECFEWLWTRLHGPEAWDANPFVVAITFRVIKANIDAPEARLAA